MNNKNMLNKIYDNLFLLLLWFINYIYDIYLNIKYTNYVYKHIEKKYFLSKITVNFDGQRFITFKCYKNLRNDNMIINMDNISNIIGFNLSKQCINIYIYFTYDDQEYILPQKLTNDVSIVLPVYNVDDIDTCIKMEYINISSYIKSQDNISHILSKYAGPKGNFYCDTDYKYSGNLILNDNNQPLLTNGDNIQLTTLLGETIDINYDKITIE